MARNHGLIHAYGERHTGRFRGAEMIGPAAAAYRGSAGITVIFAKMVLTL
jgi:hypothetical protein